MNSRERIPSRRRWAAALLPLALAGCASEGYRPGFGTPVDVAEVRRATVCNSASGAAAVTVFEDEAGVRAWQDARHVDLIGATPLPPGPFALVEHGARNTGGYAVVVARRAFVTDGVLTLRASFLMPETDTLRPEMLTSPCALIALPPGHYDLVELIDPRNRRRAISSAPPAPTAAAQPPAQ